MQYNNMNYFIHNLRQCVSEQSYNNNNIMIIVNKISSRSGFN